MYNDLPQLMTALPKVNRLVNFEPPQVTTHLTYDAMVPMMLDAVENVCDFYGLETPHTIDPSTVIAWCIMHSQESGEFKCMAFMHLARAAMHVASYADECAGYPNAQRNIWLALRWAVEGRRCYVLPEHVMVDSAASGEVQ